MKYRIDPHEVEDLLMWFIKRGFTRQVAGPQDDPHVIVLFYVWGTYVDVAHVRSVERVDVARLPTADGGDIYNPEQVIWHFFGNAIDALTALKNLACPNDDDAPIASYKPPRELSKTQLMQVRKNEPTEALRVNVAERGKLTIKLPDRR